MESSESESTSWKEEEERNMSVWLCSVSGPLGEWVTEVVNDWTVIGRVVVSLAKSRQRWLKSDDVL